MDYGETQKITFFEHKFRGTGKYKCECGYRFQRAMTTSWTENPFNLLWKEKGFEACNEKCQKELKEGLATWNCPKCGKECKKNN